jgi:Spy/CpxP family protein refolding chaperone
MMKRPVIIVPLGLLVALAGYCALYYSGTKDHRRMLESPTPELAWLKKEFQLGDADFEHIAQLHEAYMPRCAEFCQRIAVKNSELQQLVGAGTVDGKAIEAKLEEIGNLRVECQKNMFRHFLEVSHQMPSEQGRRYLQWVQQRTLTAGTDMARRHEVGHMMAH